MRVRILEENNPEALEAAIVAAGAEQLQDNYYLTDLKYSVAMSSVVLGDDVIDSQIYSALLVFSRDQDVGYV